MSFRTTDCFGNKVPRNTRLRVVAFVAINDNSAEDNWLVSAETKFEVLIVSWSSLRGME